MSKQCVSAWQGKQGNVIMEREQVLFKRRTEMEKEGKNELKGIKECMRFREK
jgi:hypothetical protein